MNKVTKPFPPAQHVLETTPAANADQIGHDATQRTAAAIQTESTSTGWDAYQVWRRFIKEARERRELEPKR
jgi:hypothetical protein